MPYIVTAPSIPTESRQKVICSYCGKKCERTNTEDHTARVHGNLPCTDKLGKGQKTIIHCNNRCERNYCLWIWKQQCWTTTKKSRLDEPENLI